MDVYIYYGGEQYGPCTLDELAEMWGAGQIQPESFCWHAGLPQWVPAAEFKPPRMDIPPPPESPAPAPVAAAIVPDAFGPAVATQTIGCPHCLGAMNPAATRCPHCQGEVMHCPRCEMRVAVDIQQKFVGIMRGGTVPVRKCRQCSKQLTGPRF